MHVNKFSALKKQLRTIEKTFQENIDKVKRLAIVVFPLEYFSSILSKDADFKDSHFTLEEIEYCKNRIFSLAGRYGAKLAISKALLEPIPMLEINILPSQTQQPLVSFRNKREFVAISITHEDDLVAAVAVPVNDETAVVLGIDAVKNTRIADVVKNNPAILRKILTPNELRAIRDFQTERRDFFAMPKIWTGKEAVSKALGVGVWHGGSLQDIEILNKKGIPVVVLKGKLLDTAKSLRLNKWKLGFAYDGEFTVALVVGSN